MSGQQRPVENPPDVGRGSAAGRGIGRWAAYALVLVLTVENAVWSALLLPLRVGGTLVPVSLVLAGVGTAVLGVAGARVLGSRRGAVAPGLLWVVLALVAGSQRREGDLVLAGGEGSGLGTLVLLFLVVGAVGAAAGYGLSSPPPGPAAPPAETGLPSGASGARRASSTSPEPDVRR